MKWKKIGRIFFPPGGSEWMNSHATNPIAVHLRDNLFRIYFNTRDTENRSSVAWVEVDVENPTRVLRVSHDPALAPGPVGCFDDSGASASCILRRNGDFWLYYQGWNLGVTVPYHHAIGVAVSADGTKFDRISLGPVMDRSDIDPYTVSHPWVIDDNGDWRLWYGSNLNWGDGHSDTYHAVRVARSRDGLAWHGRNTICVGPGQGEHYIVRPCVIRDDDCYRMWYSFRGQFYRIGYAVSADGIFWTRRDYEVGIDVSPGEWDGEEIEYPCIFDHLGQRYMLYNGNGYGRTGFGIAVLESF
jgi:predicted GH43/DUF377 family glycosyl hydrolase